MLQKHMTQYPILARMAKNYLAIQGSATPSFSGASLTDTKQCSQLMQEVFGVLQILKSAYWNRHLSDIDKAEKL
jgi:hypothetical protein